MANQSKNFAALLPAIHADLVVEERPIPTPEQGEILVRNHFIGLNPIDWKRQISGMFIASYPAILGTDLSGIVESVGPDVTQFKAGDRVLGAADGIASQKLDNGAYQTYTVVRSSSASKIPSSIGLEQATTLPTGTLTAYLMLFRVLNLPAPGTDAPPSKSTLLVWGGGSNVGNMAIQLAHLVGLNVYVTASKQNHEYLRSLGANQLFDYNSATVVNDITEAAEAEGKPITHVVDAISLPTTLGPIQEILSKSTGKVKELAHTTPWPEELAKVDGINGDVVHGEEIWLKPDVIKLGAKIFNEDLPKWLEAGVIVPPPGRVIKGGLGKIQDGLNEQKAGVSNQKLVVQV